MYGIKINGNIMLIKMFVVNLEKNESFFFYFLKSVVY